MNPLDRVTSGKQSRPPRVFIYGTEGIGKTTFAAAAPKPVFVPTEDGLGEIDCTQFPLATSFEDVESALIDLATREHLFETVVIDSLDWLERLVWDRVCRESGVTSIEKADGGYGRGYAHAVNLWRDVVAKLDRLRVDRNMVIVLVAHAKVERFEDPESSPYDRFAPRLHKLASALLCEWSDAVLFATRKVRTTTEDTGFSRKRTTAHPVGRAGGDRILRPVGGPACVAKNRFGIVDEIPLSWTAFVNALTQPKEC